jgi:hypothetical protein
MGRCRPGSVTRRASSSGPNDWRMGPALSGNGNGPGRIWATGPPPVMASPPAESHVVTDGGGGRGPSQRERATSEVARIVVVGEAPPGFEPGVEVLQTSALPLGYGARDSKPNDRQWALQSVTERASSDPRCAGNRRTSQPHFSRSPLLTALLGLIRRLRLAWFVVRQGTGPSPRNWLSWACQIRSVRGGRPAGSQAALSTLGVKRAYSRRHGKADHRGENPATPRRMERERFREPDQPAAAVSRAPDAGSARESHR